MVKISGPCVMRECEKIDLAVKATPKRDLTNDYASWIVTIYSIYNYLNLNGTLYFILTTLIF